jgi:hypothetical protein
MSDQPSMAGLLGARSSQTDFSQVSPKRSIDGLVHHTRLVPVLHDLLLTYH